MVRTSKHAVVASLALAWAFGACGSHEYGDGIGRPTYEPAERGSPLALTEVYLTDADPAQNFVELANVGSTDLALDGWLLEDGAGGAPLTGTLAVGGRVTVAASALSGIRPSTGELGVTDVHGLMRAYLAWGADPTVSASPLWQRARAAQLWTDGDLVAVGFPMKDGIAIVRDGAVTGCAAPTPGAPTEPAMVEECPALRRDLVALTEVGPALAGEPASFVEIQNISGAAIELAELRLCTERPDSTDGIESTESACVGLAPLTLAAGARQVVYLGTPVSAAADAMIVDGTPFGTAAAVGLLAPGAAAAEPNRLLDFVSYGETVAGPLTLGAIDDGLWPAGNESARAPRYADEALVALATPTNGAARWVAAKETPGTVNPDIGAASGLWTACSYVPPWLPQTRPTLVIREIRAVGRETVTLLNRGAAALDLTPIVLALSGTGGLATINLVDLPHTDPFVLAPGGTFAIALGDPADACTATQCTSWQSATLATTSGEAALFDDTAGGGAVAANLRAYVQWGTAVGSTWAASAVEASLWPTESGCGALAVKDGALALNPALDGTSPADWLFGP